MWLWSWCWFNVPYLCCGPHHSFKKKKHNFLWFVVFVPESEPRGAGSPLCLTLFCSQVNVLTVNQNAAYHHHRHHHHHHLHHLTTAQCFCEALIYVCQSMKYLLFETCGVGAPVL